MTETPAAAAPAVTPAAPAAAPAPAVAPAPAAPVAAPATPPATPPAPATPPPVESLLPDEAPAVPATPQTEAEKLAAAKALVKEADAAADPNSGKAWLLNEGVMGQGEKPSWFKSDKYKTVAAQAEAYTALESRFGAFKGAPKDEKGGIKYDYTPPEGVSVKMDHPLMTEFTKWAGESQLSQEGYTNMLGMLIQYEAANAPSMATIKDALGADADTRIAQVAQWGKANLGNEGYATLRAATSGKNAADVFKVMEAVIAKTAQFKMPKPGADIPTAAGGDQLDKIKADMGAKDASGKLRIHTDNAYNAEINKRFRDYYAAAEQ